MNVQEHFNAWVIVLTIATNLVIGVGIYLINRRRQRQLRCQYVPQPPRRCPKDRRRP